MTARTRTWRFLLAFLLQAGLLGWLVADRGLLLARGTEIRLAVNPVDPRDFVRGDYVVLAYPMSRLRSDLVAGDDIVHVGERVFVELEPDGETWKAVALWRDRPAGKRVLAGKVVHAYAGPAGCACQLYEIRYGLEKFFVPEGLGRELEAARDGRRIEVDVAVTEGGRAALKRLRVDGEIRFAEELF